MMRFPCLLDIHVELFPLDPMSPWMSRCHLRCQDLQSASERFVAKLPERVMRKGQVCNWTEAGSRLLV